MILRAAVLTLGVLAFSLLTLAGPASAAPWDNEPFWDKPSAQSRDDDDRTYDPPPARQPAQSGEIRDGGPRPEIAPKAPIVIAFSHPEYSAGTIVIDSGARKLYFVLPGNRAFQYPISVGREGFAWAGNETISRKQAWPDWHPPAEMRQRDPKLPEKMLGGVRNPLGAIALYLGNTLYRIHGTNDEKTIGFASSSGCFRMLNASVLHLAQFVQIGTPVSVVNGLPRQPQAPVAEVPPPIRLPPIASNRQQPPPSPVRAAPDDDRFDDNRLDDDRWTSGASAPPARRLPRDSEDADVANITVTPSERRRVDEYDPYVRGPYTRRPFGRDRYADPYDDRAAPDSYASERPRGRAWYDDERDDH